MSGEITGKLGGPRIPEQVTIIVHSYIPITGKASVGGFDWGYEGAAAEEGVRSQFDLDSDTTHHDYAPSHQHRLLRLSVPAADTAEEVTAFIEGALLEDIESGDFDDHPEVDLGRHIPTTTKEN